MVYCGLLTEAEELDSSKDSMEEEEEEEDECGQRKESRKRRKGLPSMVLMADKFNIKTKGQGLFTQHDPLWEHPFPSAVYTCILCTYFD